MDNPTPADESTVAPSTGPGPNSLHSPRSGKESSTPQTVLTAELVEIIKALAVIQDGLRLFALAGGLLRPPSLNANGILVLALRLHGHTLGVGPEGSFLVDGISVMEGRTE